MFNRRKYEDWEAGEIPMRVRYEDVVCKFCGSHKVVSYGSYKGIPRWWCKNCRRKFVDNDALPRMRTSIEQVAAALSMFYEGMSLHGIRRNLEQTYRNYPSNSTIYEWVIRFTKVAIKAARDYKPNVGDTWVADETVLKIEGANLWFWDILCDKTRFLLASHISLSRTTRDARILVERAADRAGNQGQNHQCHNGRSGVREKDCDCTRLPVMQSVKLANVLCIGKKQQQPNPYNILSGHLPQLLDTYSMSREFFCLQGFADPCLEN